jgi:hypothetical protein
MRAQGIEGSPDNGGVAVMKEVLNQLPNALFTPGGIGGIFFPLEVLLVASIASFSRYGSRDRCRSIRAHDCIRVYSITHTAGFQGFPLLKSLCHLR